MLGACSNDTAESSNSPVSVIDRAGQDGTNAAVTTEIEPDTVVDDRIVVGRTNVHASGNRYLSGSLDLTAEPTSIELPFPAVWLLPLDDGSLIVVGADGSAAMVASDQSIAPLRSVDPSIAPLAISEGGEIVLFPGSEGVESDLPDASEVEDGAVRAWFDGATERLPHGALGDVTESTRLVIVRRLVSDPMDDTGEAVAGQESVVVDLENDATGSVFEGLAPLLADVDGDGTVDVLTTISDSETGARLAVFSTGGELLAQSEPVGRGNRWRHQIAVAPTGPNGELEVIEVQTPHIGGLLQFQRVDGETLALQHQIGDFQSHVLGSRNLDGAAVFDADGDGQPEAVLPTQDRTSLAIVDAVPAEGGPELIDLTGANANGATVLSNLALVQTDDGLLFAVGLDDGRLLVWRP